MQSLIYDVDHVNHYPRLSASLDFGHVLITPIFQNNKFTHYETKVKRFFITTILPPTQTTDDAKRTVREHLSQ